MITLNYPRREIQGNRKSNPVNQTCVKNRLKELYNMGGEAWKTKNTVSVYSAVQVRWDNSSKLEKWVIILRYNFNPPQQFLSTAV